MLLDFYNGSLTLFWISLLVANIFIIDPILSSIFQIIEFFLLIPHFFFFLLREGIWFAKVVVLAVAA